MGLGESPGERPPPLLLSSMPVLKTGEFPQSTTTASPLTLPKALIYHWLSPLKGKPMRQLCASHSPESHSPGRGQETLPRIPLHPWGREGAGTGLGCCGWLTLKQAMRTVPLPAPTRRGTRVRPHTGHQPAMSPGCGVSPSGLTVQQLGLRLTHISPSFPFPHKAVKSWVLTTPLTHG